MVEPSHFIDLDFPPHKSMLKPLSKLFKSVWNKIDWRYAEEYLHLQSSQFPENEDFTSIDISQTISPLSFFHDGLKLLCLNPKLLKQLLKLEVLSSSNNQKRFLVKLNILGEWKSFILDGYFPVVKFEDGNFRYFLCPPSKSKTSSSGKNSVSFYQNLFLMT